MENRIKSPVLFLLLTIYASTIALSQSKDSVDISKFMVMRSQFQSIADEVVAKAKLDSSERVIILVEGEEWRSLAENAFIEALQRNKNTPVLNSGIKGEKILHLFILNADIKIKEIYTGKLERSIITIIEARSETSGENVVQLLGTYRREIKDTTSVSNDGLLSADKKEKGTYLQLLLTPLVVISSAILIIYLFFTVRS